MYDHDPNCNIRHLKCNISNLKLTMKPSNMKVVTKKKQDAGPALSVKCKMRGVRVSTGEPKM